MRTANNLLLKTFCVLLLVLSSCVYRQLGMDNCGFSTTPQAVDGWEIIKLNEEIFEGNLKDFTMLSNDLGYLLMSAYGGEGNRVLKTADGGKTWNIIYSMEPRKPQDIFFIDENIGLMSIGAPSSGQLFKTIDAGISWERIVLNEIRGIFRDIQIDDNGNLYSLTYSNNEISQLVRSEDQGEQWEVIFESDKIKRSESGMSFILHTDNIFIAGREGELIVTNLDGELQSIRNAGEREIQDIDVFDINNIVVRFRDRLVRTSDGGTNWTEIHNDKSAVIDFYSQNEILAVLEKSCCSDYDVCYSNDAMAISNNATATWQEGETIMSGLARIKSVNKIADFKYKMMIGSWIYEISKL